MEKKEAPEYHRTIYHSKFDPYKEQIIEWRCEPHEFNGTRIFRELKARGYTGSIRPVYCFALILAASRKKAVCFSLREDADAIYEAVQDLFDELGGVTLELLIDNPKALVIENNPKSEDEIRYNPHALLMAANLGTELNACPCYWPRKKARWKIHLPISSNSLSRATALKAWKN